MSSSGNPSPTTTAATLLLLLSSSPSLLKEHDELVKTSIITEAQFWSTRKDQVHNFEALLQQQKLATIQNPLDAMRKKFILTPEVMKSLFTQYPLLKKAFSDLVPSMTYLQSLYFNQCNTSENILNSYYIQENTPSSTPNVISTYASISLDNLNDNSFSHYLIKGDVSNSLIRKLNYNSSKEITSPSASSFLPSITSSTLAISSSIISQISNPILKNEFTIEENIEYLHDKNAFDKFFTKKNSNNVIKKSELKIITESPLLLGKNSFPNVSGLKSSTSSPSLELLKLYYHQSEIKDQVFISRLRQTLEDNLPDNPSHFLFSTIQRVLELI